jgi:hypothetical protein
MPTVTRYRPQMCARSRCGSSAAALTRCHGWSWQSLLGKNEQRVQHAWAHCGSARCAVSHSSATRHGPAGARSARCAIQNAGMALPGLCGLCRAAPHSTGTAPRVRACQHCEAAPVCNAGSTATGLVYAKLRISQFESACFSRCFLYLTTSSCAPLRRTRTEHAELATPGPPHGGVRAD